MIGENDLNKLSAPTPKNEIKFRVGRTFEYDNKKFAMMLKYIDARYVQDTLDKIIGIGNWSNEYLEIKGNLFCKITIYFFKEDGSIGSISKMDCGVESNVEKEKGEASDSFKRCAVHFGIARDLYVPEKNQWDMVAEFEKDSKGNYKKNIAKNWKPKNF